jgi:translocation and assembly module TamA
MRLFGLENVTAAGVDISKSLSQNSQFSYGVSLREERFFEGGVVITNQLVLPSLIWQTVSADDLRDPNRGFRLSTTLLGASEDLGSDVSLLQLNVNAKTVYRIGRGRLLGRLTAGQTWISEQDTLPTSLAYFVGGDYSVRGYDFESIGIETDKGELRGGTNSVAASIEYERAVRGAFSLAAFVDAGDAYDDKSNIDLKLGVGVGARWRLPFGAIRLDVAQAQDLPGKPARVHFTFGTDL